MRTEEYFNITFNPRSWFSSNPPVSITLAAQPSLCRIPIHPSHHEEPNYSTKEMKVNQSPTSEEEKTSNDMAASTSTSSSTRRAKTEFPIKLYAMLELAENLFEFSQAVTWLPHGRAFRILNKVKFMEEVAPLFFNQTKFRSFNRQLNMWGFRR